jgi:hypothetical protein
MNLKYKIQNYKYLLIQIYKMSFKGGSKGGAAPALFNNPGYKSTNNIQFRG